MSDSAQDCAPSIVQLVLAAAVGGIATFWVERLLSRSSSADRHKESITSLIPAARSLLDTYVDLRNDHARSMRENTGEATKAFKVRLRQMAVNAQHIAPHIDKVRVISHTCSERWNEVSALMRSIEKDVEAIVEPRSVDQAAEVAALTNLGTDLRSVIQSMLAAFGSLQLTAASDGREAIRRILEDSRYGNA